MLEETCCELAELAGVWAVWLEQAAKRPRTASEARESVNLLDNVICLTPFFDNPSIAEDRGGDNENDFSEKGESVPYMFIFLDQKNHSRKGSGSVLVLI